MSEHDLQLRKSLSQNFLINKTILQRAVHKAEIQKGDRVFEIGPGLGALTLTLLEAGADVVAVEKDHSFAQILPNLLKEYSDRLEVIEGDALQYSIKQPMKMVSNIPFQITVPILSFIASNQKFFTTGSPIILFVQKEMGEKIVAQAGTKNNNPLALFCQFHFELKLLADVSRKSFFPIPKSDCTLLSLYPKNHLPLSHDQSLEFFSFVDNCFTHKRKMLRSTIKGSDLLQKIGQKETARPEDLSLNDYLLLFRLFTIQSEGKGSNN